MATRRTYRVNADRWIDLMDILVGTPEDFNPDSATLRGRHVDDSWKVAHGVGKLPRELAIIFASQVKRGDIDYVIYSYATPIAYRFRGKWVVPTVKYSVTTSKHQGKVRTAVSQITGGI